MVQLRRDAAIVGGRRKASDPDPITLRHVRLFAAARQSRPNRSSRRCSTKWRAFGVPIEGLHTETGPGVYEAAILFSEALEQADRAILFKTGAKEIASRFDIMPSFMAKWSQRAIPAARATSTSRCPTARRNRFYDPKGSARR